MEEVEDFDPECTLGEVEYLLKYLKYEFPSIEQEQDFIKYCNFRLYCPQDEVHFPIPLENIKPYFLELFLEIKNIILEAFQRRIAEDNGINPITNEICNIYNK
jgi:hypothetical protein